ncbi:MAG: hypothetical protein DCF19_18605 [Pseudanabaena frigida]|uniref:PEP-CTERM sorting domain-containing protein n=1 Tax=Pseudanabaena frigida TaxID=945775 RepID=A0A2W4VXB8_9CYAN|nr:MAG: hypothetical protein DCF19_18605 [Pseudanabaena frigida]
MLTLSKPTASISNIKGLIGSSLVAIAASTISIGALTDSASAISLIGNRTSATNISGSISAYSSNLIDTIDKLIAIQFTTPSTEPLGYLLNSVSIRVGNYRTTAGESIFLTITDNSNLTSPGSDLPTLSLSTPTSNTVGVKDLTFTSSSSSPTTFAPNTTYWLLIGAGNASTSFNWVSNDDPGATYTSITPTGIGSLGPLGYQESSDGGGVYGSLTNQFSTSASTQLSTFNIDVTPVPFEFEASGGIAILGGLFVANKLRKRMQKNKIDN